MAGMKKYRFVGLDKDVWLPDDIEVQIKIITNSRFRSSQKFSGQTKTTFHDTGNSKTNALQEWTWANNGREGAGVGGYNFIVDDMRIIQCGPLDEVTWAAGTAEGNRISWHIEQAWGGDVDFTRSLEVAAALHGGLIAAKGWDADTALVKHQYWYGKWCPGQILNKGLWSQVVSMVSDAALASRLAAMGEAAAGAVYVKPDPIPALDAISKAEGIAPAIVHDPSSGVDFIWTGDRYRVVQATGRYRWADERSAKLGPDLKPDEEFDGDFVFFVGGKWWLYTPYATRIKADDVERISDIKGEMAA